MPATPLTRARTRRATVFAPRLQALIDDHLGKDLVRLESDTIGIAGAELSDRILAARKATETERPTFKPLHGRSISKTEASSVMRTIGKDVRKALESPIPHDTDLSGPWPLTGHNFLRDLILRDDPARLRILMSRTLEIDPKLTWSTIVAGAALPRRPRPGPHLTHIGSLFAEAEGYHDRRYAMGMYRRAAAPVCFTVSTLVANALWLGSPFDDGDSNRNVLYEAMRLLPPSWNLLRNRSPEYPALDSRIGSGDDVLVLPLLTHRDPALWEAPQEFRPARWDTLDPDATPGYMPFGHASERCWGRHMVMPLAELLLDHIRRTGLVVAPGQRTADVPLVGLLGVKTVHVGHKDRVHHA
ncbi:cytochrome P450 [Streptomyces sp. NPDC048550]|uniref:cytochrome P450 n=1 Tax=unclassified Streptomyces TaxID=2593676 RepID=UPI002254D52B|nr:MULTISPECIES: cytochrome P450 [unclassified Streptomyces]MCX5150307.1 cytochrome P450 [Streptomyces sp. NBC_00320]WSN48002.1 cytochrome P450 [Streptomyces sp. NBC_01296]WSW62586.1 cytochrome P450 [Streptomyces sp. NBC_00998]